MGRKYGRLPSDFWTWPDIQKLSATDRYITAYLWTTPHGNSIGAFYLPHAHICADTGLDPRTISKFAAKMHINVVRTGKNALWYLQKYMESFPPQNPNMVRRWIKDLESLDESDPLVKDITHNFETVLSTVNQRFAINVESNPPYSPPHEARDKPRATDARAALKVAAQTLQLRRRDSTDT